MTNQPVDAFAAPPDPGQAATIDALVECLRRLRAWAGDPSYAWITERVNAAWTTSGRPTRELAGKTTVVDCFRSGRRRLSADLVIAVVEALRPDVGYVAQWRQAVRVVTGETRAAAQVRVQDSLPPDLPGFTGRAAELDRLWQAIHAGIVDGGPVVVSAIAGMAGVGKTQLAVHAGHRLVRAGLVDRVLFVNLRGFHPDPGQPPADPVAVLDGFLRLLGVPGQQIPHDPRARADAYRGRLAGTRTLVVLDNAADAGQVRPLLPGTPGCPVLVTSRRSLGLDPSARLTVDAFTPGDALDHLARAVPDVPTGPDPAAATRIARSCGYLPLSLGLLAAHARATPGWTLTDHADRLEERHRQRRLDSAVELALDLSYRHLPADRQRLFRLAALHPGQDLDAHAAAALADLDLPTARSGLDDLGRDHLLQATTPGRYTFHDLVRAYATNRTADEDPPPARHAALTRLFDYVLAGSAAAMDLLAPAEAHRRPRVPAAVVPVPALTGLDAARSWLDVERPNLVAVAAYTADEGWPAHATRLSLTLFRYLAGGYHADALAIHGHAHRAAERVAEPAERANILVNVGSAEMHFGRYDPAAGHLREALTLARRADDPAAQARALTNLGNIEANLGRYRSCADHHERALTLYRQAGDRTSAARALGSLGALEGMLGNDDAATDRLEQAATLFHETGDHSGDAWVTSMLGELEMRAGRHDPAVRQFRRALELCRRIGDRSTEARTLDSLGGLSVRRGEPAEAAEYYELALALFRETGEAEGETIALNGLGEAALAGGHLADAVARHSAALDLAVPAGERAEQARAHAGLGHAHAALGDPAAARDHYQEALGLYTDLGMPQAEDLRDRLARAG